MGVADGLARRGAPTTATMWEPSRAKASTAAESLQSLSTIRSDELLQLTLQEAAPVPPVSHCCRCWDLRLLLVWLEPAAVHAPRSVPRELLAKQPTHAPSSVLLHGIFQQEYLYVLQCISLYLAPVGPWQRHSALNTSLFLGHLASPARPKKQQNFRFRNMQLSPRESEASPRELPLLLSALPPAVMGVQCLL